MAYSLKAHDPSLQAGVRRIARSQITRALEELDDAGLDPATTVHQIRKRCKKLRALVRLVRPGFPGYARENAAFRDLARRVSGMRDADVLLATCDGLTECYTGDGGEALGPVREWLAADVRPPGERALDDQDAEIREALVAALGRVGEWSLEGKGFEPAAAGLRKTYARARKAMCAVERDGPADAFHEWRKSVKYHWYHTRLLEPIWPEGLHAHARAADRLGEVLGDHHDLAVLSERLSEAPAGIAGSEAHAVAEGLIERRRIELETEAFDLGAQLLAEKPKALARRWTDYWRNWRAAD